MTDNSSATEKHSHGVSKFLSKSRWRSRSNADEEPPAPQKTDQNIADFLKPSVGTRQRPSVPLAPKIDIAAAQKWTQNATGNGISTPSSLRGRGGSQKKPRRPNLTVTFLDTQEVMGEGGEECDAPTMEISRRKESLGQQGLTRAVTHRESGSTRTFSSPPRPQRSMTSDQMDTIRPYGTQPEERSESRAAAYRSLFGEDPQDAPLMTRPEDEDFAPHQLKRAPTGFRNHNDTQSGAENPYRQHRERGSLSSTYSEEDSLTDSPARPRKQPTSVPFQLPELKSTIDNSPIDIYSAMDRRKLQDAHHPTPVEQSNRIQRMRQEEGKVLHQNARRSIIELAEEDISRLASVEPTLPKLEPTLPSLPMSKPQQHPTTSNLAQNQGFRAYSPVTDPRQRSGTGGSASGSTPTSATAYSSPSMAYQPASATFKQPHTRQPSVRDNQSHNRQPSVRDNRVQDSFSRPIPSARKPIGTEPGLAVPLSGPQAQHSISLPSRPAPSPLTIPHELIRNESRQGERSRTPDFKTPATATSLKTPSSSISQAAYEDFAQRCEHMRSIFRLQAEFEKPLSEYSPTQLLRAASWWFVKGRAGMEILIRSRPKSADGSAKSQLQLAQPHVDLAKCWWILAEILPRHQSLPPSTEISYMIRSATANAQNDAALSEFYDSCELLQSSLKGLLSSMSRNQAMPPSSALIQGQDQSIWVQYPNFSSDILPMLSGTKRSLTGATAIRLFDPLSVMAVADTKRDFAYHRWFVQVTIQSDESEGDSITLPCLFSVMRTRNDWHPKVAICSQKELISIIVTGERKQGPSWEDVKWSESDTSLQIKLAQGYVMNAKLNEQDYQILAAMYKKAFTVQTSLFPLDNEQVVFEVPLEDFQYTDTLRPPAFPLERMRRCRVRVFAKFEERAEGARTRRFWRGLRFLVVTSPKNRTLANASHDIGYGEPIIIEMLTETLGGENFPAMRMHIKEQHRQSSLFMVFSQVKERQTLYNALNEAELAQEEMQFAALRLKKLGIESIVESEEYAKMGNNPLGRMNWQEVSVVNKDPQNPDDDFGEVVGSDSLRIVANGAGGTITDRINLGMSFTNPVHLIC